MRIAVGQAHSRMDREANLAVGEDLLRRAADAGADVAVLPEYLDYFGPRSGVPKPEPVGGSFGTRMAEAARRHGMWVVAGSFHEASPDPGRTYNTSLVFDRSGALAGAYRKIHLFDVDIPGGVRHMESDELLPGVEAVTVDIEGVRFGLSICYDLRFPELYRRLAETGARVLLVPSAFAAHTGRDHWEVLLRARAIENQCYVAAAAQWGENDLGWSFYGRSMVVDPWGTVVAQAVDGTGVITADLDLDRLVRIRQELPSLANRRL